jgi:hypothetical protein
MSAFEYISKKIPEIYRGIAGFVGFITFICSWIYCINEYGFLWGFGLGWIPSFMLAAILGFLWPVLAIILVIMMIAS